MTGSIRYEDACRFYGRNVRNSFIGIAIAAFVAASAPYPVCRYGLSALQTKAKYRSPDNILDPSNELKKITKNRYQKVSGSLVIGKYLSLDNTRSESFRNFIIGVRRITAHADD